ncbi:hypothetical protein BegalDRAFT_1603 [Beggiatoa alba B18LD]|uniref:UPF0225 protein BegalDRAFT_1603 n=1 Tax=Beggiatoa alba B18LD TaxID=395493 RepID=I3CFT9_9GAMM|nr:YchJ family metal-binding protein [Beggiatoa alba]EIJ42482.1 hypothetical protein BegalDRAFT_1603 [Beggiatoa alba B18LD]
MPKKPLINPCPCGSERPLQQCCLLYMQGEVFPPTAEALMRSRYTAYVLGNTDYLRATWHPETCPTTLNLTEAHRWTRLQIVKTQAGSATETQGVVHFKAYYKLPTGRGGRLEEISHFVRIGQQWFYVDGQLCE